VRSLISSSWETVRTPRPASTIPSAELSGNTF
jgi:hypothetical protein